MQGIVGIEEVVRILGPHWEEIVYHFETENRKFKDLIRADHTTLGMVIKCHLISEIYVERYLREKLALTNLTDARLSYFQKVMLLPDRASAPAIVKLGLLRLNRIRNSLAHDLRYDPSVEDIRPMMDVLKIAGRQVDDMEVLAVIESFATIACTWLLVPPPNLGKLFERAFCNVVVMGLGEEDYVSIPVSATHLCNLRTIVRESGTLSQEPFLLRRKGTIRPAGGACVPTPIVVVLLLQSRSQSFVRPPHGSWSAEGGLPCHTGCASSIPPADAPDDDYCIPPLSRLNQPLGLVARDAPIRVANPIYREVIPRDLTWTTQESLTHAPAWYVDGAGNLRLTELLAAFQEFFREHSEYWIERFQYREAGPHLLLQAFLQRIVNSGGRIEREYGLGRMRTDLLIVWPVAAGAAEPAATRKMVIECKLLHRGLDQTIREGLSQTRAYMDRCGAAEAHLVVFDRTADKPWEQKLFRRDVVEESVPITVWGM